jgi:hypothetical protein
LGPAADVPDRILDLIERVPHTAAIVLDAKYDVLAWNPLAAALLEDFSAQPRRERNIICRYFLRPEPSRYGITARGAPPGTCERSLRDTSATTACGAPTSSRVSG